MFLTGRPAQRQSYPFDVSNKKAANSLQGLKGLPHTSVIPVFLIRPPRNNTRHSITSFSLLTLIPIPLNVVQREPGCQSLSRTSLPSCEKLLASPPSTRFHDFRLAGLKPPCFGLLGFLPFLRIDRVCLAFNGLSVLF